MPRVVKQEGDDPDPTPYLYVSLEQKRIDQTKPYDAKKACWVPDEAEGFVQGEIQSTKGDMVNVKLPGGEVINSILLFSIMGLWENVINISFQWFFWDL